MAGTFPGAGRREGRLTPLIPANDTFGMTVNPDGAVALPGPVVFMTLLLSPAGCDTAILGFAEAP